MICVSGFAPVRSCVLSSALKRGYFMAATNLDRLAASAAAFWLRPQGILSGATAAAAVSEGRALPLAGGVFGLAFAEVEIAIRDDVTEAGMSGAAVSLESAKRWAVASGLSARHDDLLQALTAAR